MATNAEMNADQDFQDDEIDMKDRCVRLTKGFNIKDLLDSKGFDFEIDMEDLKDMDECQQHELTEDVFDNIYPMGLVEDDGYDDAAPFDIVAQKMIDVEGSNGKLKKRIIRQGKGEPIPLGSKVFIHYSAFLEYADEPFDSTYLRKRPHSFITGAGMNIVGLDKAILTMVLSEKSQFLIHYDWAYGQVGIMERIPPKSNILFEIEVVKYILHQGIEQTEEIEELNGKQKFMKIYKQCIALQMEGKEQYVKQCYKNAVMNYNKAINKLETAIADDMEDQEKQEDLFIKLYTNLAICHIKLNHARKSCDACNRIFDLVRGTKRKIPAKVWYQKGSALIMLNDYDAALKCLKNARAIEPNNTDISKKLYELQKLIKNRRESELNVAKKMFGSMSVSKSNTTETIKLSDLSEEFKIQVTKICEGLKAEESEEYFNLPAELVPAELDFLKTEAKRHGLVLNRYKREGNDKFYLSKIRNE